MSIQEVNESIALQRKALLNHPLYSKIESIEHLRSFMEIHVYAVWDFMSLLKALQQKLTCTTVPWFASEFPQTRYLINEIVLAEESDLTIDGRRLSHFEMYVEAMEDVGADTEGINSLLLNLRLHKCIFKAIESMKVDDRIKSALTYTFSIIEEGRPHEIAAAFTFGREDLIPEMFTEIVKGFQDNLSEINLSKLLYYFERHIALDADEHGPMAMQMIVELCGDDIVKWEEVKQVSKHALEMRTLLWDAIESKL